MEKVFGYFPHLVNRRQQKSGYLSGGEQQMLVIGRALMARPKLMMLDEPSLGLAPGLVNELFVILKQINLQEKTTLLIAEQNAAVSLAIADHGVILQNGKVGFSGTAAQLMDRRNIKGYYLGEKSEGTSGPAKQNVFQIVNPARNSLHSILASITHFISPGARKCSKRD